MAKTSVNPNPIEMNTSVTRQLRETLMHLARTPGLTKSGTLTELVSTPGGSSRFSGIRA